MKCMFLLSGENQDLSREEVLALANTHKYEEIENILIVDCDIKYKRLAMTRKVYQYLFACTYKDLNSYMEKYPWTRVYNKNFSLKIVNIGGFKFEDKEAELAKNIWRRVKMPRVDLKHSQTKIELIVTESKIYCGKVICTNKEEFMKRRPHLRPEHTPTSLNPKLARACINLTGIPTGKVVCDPFCGMGGLLIEAGLLRFNTIGYDIMNKTLKRCQKNLDYFKIKRYKLEKHDATKLSREVDYIVTDLPYGHSSAKTGDLNEIYSSFLKNLNKILKYKAVVIFPSFVKHSKLIKEAGLRLENEFHIYIHKSLTRVVTVVSKK